MREKVEEVKGLFEVGLPVTVVSSPARARYWVKKMQCQVTVT